MRNGFGSGHELQYATTHAHKSYPLTKKKRTRARVARALRSTYL